MNTKFDTLVIGPISLDCNIDYQGKEIKEVGGAVVASGYAAARSGNKTAVFTKFNSKDVDIDDVFEESRAEIFWKESEETTSIQNKYLSSDRERRECRNMGRCDKFLEEELPRIETKIYHFAGLTYGDFDGTIFEAVSKKGKVAVDVQCLLRHVEANGTMAFHNWEEKRKYLPVVDYLKTDAAEAEILTGCSDRCAAAKMLHEWGAKEIMVTHNTEVLIYDGQEVYTCPIKARNLSGRTGRGDTCFAGYITERERNNVWDSLLYATALVSLKMETPGPFKGTRQDVLTYIDTFYPEYR